MLYFNESTSLYIYSSFLQANAAIFAVLGVFIVYKMQSHKASIDVIKNVLYNIHLQSFECVIQFEKLKRLKKLENFKAKSNNDTDYPLFETWVFHIDKIHVLKELVTLPTWLLSSAMIVDSIALFICSNLSKYHPYAEVWFASAVVLSHILLWVFMAFRLVDVVKNR